MKKPCLGGDYFYLVLSRAAVAGALLLRSPQMCHLKQVKHWCTSEKCLWNWGAGGSNHLVLGLASFMSSAVSLSAMKSILVSFVETLAFAFLKSKHVFSCQCLIKGKPKDHTWDSGSPVSACWLCCCCVLLLFPWPAALVSEQCLGRWGCPVSISSTEAEKALLGACCLPAAVQGPLTPLGKGICWASDPQRDQAHSVSAVPVRLLNCRLGQAFTQMCQAG